MRKTTPILLLLSLLLLYSCPPFLGVISSDIQTDNVEVSSKEIVGKWKMDIHSYKDLTGMKGDSIWILFKPDSTFEMNNSEHLFDYTIDYKPSIGVWRIKNNFSYPEEKQLRLDFEGSKASVNLDIYKKGDNYLLWYFLTDPDAGKRIAFIK